MKNKSLLFFIAFIFVFLPNAIAQNSQTEEILTLEKAMQIALENNTEIKKSQIQLKQIERTYKHKWNNFLPSINTNVSASDNSGISSNDNNTISVSTGINSSINISAGLGKKLQSINESYKNGLLDYEDTVNQIKVGVTESFYSLLYMEKQLELSKEDLALYEKQYEQTKIKKSRGLVPELDLLTSQLDFENAKISFKNTEKTYTNTLFSFLNDIGYKMTDGSVVKIEGSLDDYEKYSNIDLSKLNLESLIENTSSIRSIKSSITQTQLSLEQTKLNTYTPSLSISANVNPYSQSYLLKTKKSTKTDSWMVSIGLSYSLDNLIPGSSAKDNISTIEDNLSTMQLQLEETKKQLITKALEMIRSIEIAKETLENCQQNVKLAKKSYELAETAYKNGSKELSALQSVQSSYNNAKVQLSNQQLSLINSIIELKSLLNIKD